MCIIVEREFLCGHGDVFLETCEASDLHTPCTDDDAASILSSSTMSDDTLHFSFHHHSDDHSHDDDQIHTSAPPTREATPSICSLSSLSSASTASTCATPPSHPTRLNRRCNACLKASLQTTVSTLKPVLSLRNQRLLQDLVDGLDRRARAENKDLAMEVVMNLGNRQRVKEMGIAIGELDKVVLLVRAHGKSDNRDSGVEKWNGGAVEARL